MTVRGILQQMASGAVVGMKPASLLLTLALGVSGSALTTASPAVAQPHGAAAATAATASALEQEVCGTWVLQQVSTAASLDTLRPRLDAALQVPGVVGLSVRFPWDAADMTGTQTTTAILTKARAIATANGKQLSIRFMAGAHTPSRIFTSGAAYVRNSAGAKAPLPWDNATGQHSVFLREYDRYVAKLAAWSRANDVHLLHMSWYALDWAELNHGKEVRAASGYTQDRWLAGHKELITLAAKYAATDLAVELPLSGYGPLSGGQSAALADHVVSVMGSNSPSFFIQGNGWDETREWGAPNMTVEAQFDRIWAKPVKRGLQMIQPDGYDWALVYNRLALNDATYAEVYLPSFWQVPGPSSTLNHNTSQRVAQLKSEVAAFGQTC